MRIGIDLRLLQFSAIQRGYGQYLRSALKGLNLAFATEQVENPEFYFFRFGSRPLPEEILDQSSPVFDVPLKTPSLWIETGSFWSRARSQLIPVLPGRARWAYWMSQGREIDALAKQRKLSVYFAPAPMFPEQGPLPKLSVPTVFAFHDSIPFVYRERYIDEWDVDQRKLYLGQRQSYQNADRVAAVSESARQDAIDNFAIPPDKVDVARNSIDPTFGERIDAKTQCEIRERYRLKHPYFVFCSILDYHKNVDTVVSALSKLLDRTGKPFQLAVIGGLPEKQRDKVRGLAFDGGLTGKDVIMTGQVSDLELRSLFQSSVAILSPSLAEGFGYPVLQAMLSGVPILASDIPPYREVMGQVGLRLNPLDSYEWSAAMERVAVDTAYRMSLMDGAEQRAQEFNIRLQGKQLLETFKKAG